MSGSGEDRFVALAAAYALGALDADELRDFEAHLPDCDGCRAEVEAYRAVAGLLAYGVPAVEPPAALGDTILARARDAATTREPSTSRDAPASSPSVEDGSAGRATTPDAPGSLDRERGPGWFSGWLAPATVALAAASLLLAVGMSIGFLNERSARLQSEQALAEAIDELAERNALLGALLSETVSAAHLSSTEAEPSIRLFWNRDRDVVVVAAFNLPPAPAGRTYQLWGIPEGESPVSLGTFNTADDGRATVVLPVPGGVDVQQSDLSAVTDEPAGGSPQPTTTPFLLGAWEHAQ